MTVDLTMTANTHSASSTEVGESSSSSSPPSQDQSNLGDEERLLSGRSSATRTNPDESHHDLATNTNTNFIKKRASQIIDAVSITSRRSSSHTVTIHPRLAALIEAYAKSDIAAEISKDKEEMWRRNNVNGNGAQANGGASVDVALESALLRGRKRATWPTQFRILSGRAFKNLYRDPALLAAHYLSSVGLACESLKFFLLGGEELTGWTNDSDLWIVLPQCHERYTRVPEPLRFVFCFDFEGMQRY